MPRNCHWNSWLSGQDLNCGLVASNICQSTDLSHTSHIIGVGLLLKGEAPAEPSQLLIPKTVSDDQWRFFFMLHSKPDRSPPCAVEMSCCYCCCSLLTVNNTPSCDTIKIILVMWWCKWTEWPVYFLKDASIFCLFWCWNSFNLFLLYLISRLWFVFAFFAS